jgi:hypothetical protein
MTHSNICSLNDDDIFLGSWNEGYVVQPAMWNNSEAWLFWITIGWEMLNHEIIAVMLAT